ncbi:hypothetical protein IAD21_03412 [Abditibacteriota bacterium]|nr:hypothetical protein IAD21_03412 [Abditibacteriota bacterium]
MAQGAEDKSRFSGGESVVKRILQTFFGILILLAVVGWLFPIHPPRHNARSMWCQSNLKQISLALMQYTQDYDECLPLRHWKAPLLPYTKSESIFQCPETSATERTSDYFFNARFVGASIAPISSPNTLILLGDGQADARLDPTLFRFPVAWLQDQSSPAWRHLGRANYGFSDGHVKWLKVQRINRYFRVVN